MHVESWRWAYPGLLPQEYLDQLSVDRRARRWAAFIGADGSRAMTWVAHDERGCCGLATAGPARPEAAGIGEVYDLYVSERVVGRGVGHALIAYTVAQLKATLHASAILWVLEDNQRARRFYEREGWLHDGARQKAAVGDTRVNTVRYRRIL